MLGSTDTMKDIVRRQKEIAAELETACTALEHSDAIKENKSLTAANKKLSEEYMRAKDRIQTLSQENARLKAALHGSVFSERVKLIGSAKRHLNHYFQTNIGIGYERIAVIERNVKTRIRGMRLKMASDSMILSKDIEKTVSEMEVFIDKKIARARADAAEKTFVLSHMEREELKNMPHEPVTDEQIREMAKRNSFERFIGLNILNAAGILLLIIGAITAARFAYLQMPDMLRGIMIFALGGIMLVAGELLNRKKPNVFSLGISAGGVAILYVALATSYFGLGIMDMYAAILLCVLITAGAFLLSIRYSSQVIAAFALIGGYLPMLSINTDPAMLYGAMVYITALGLLALLLSFRKKWTVTAYIGLLLNIAAVITICWIVGGTSGTAERIAAVLFTTLALLLYTAIPIIGSYRNVEPFKVQDVILLAINTVSMGVIMYWMFAGFGWQHLNGLLAIALAALYLLLGLFVEKRFPRKEAAVRTLFYLTGLVFTVLVIPLQFGLAWVSLGWLAQGVSLSVYGIIRDSRRFKLAGYAIGGLCLGAFILLDVTSFTHYLFAYKYLSITLGSAAILGALLYKGTTSEAPAKGYKHCVLINIWCYAMYLMIKLADSLQPAFADNPVYNIGYIISAAAVVVSFLYAFAIARVKRVADRGTQIISIILYAFGLCFLFIRNLLGAPVYRNMLASADNPGAAVFGALVFIVMGALCILALRDALKLAMRGQEKDTQWYPLTISGFFLIILMQTLIWQYQLPFTHAAISIVFVIAALAWIILGFIRRYAYLRRFGLALAILSIVKLFLVDMFTLTEGFRIVSYFALGVTLLAISYVYQYFSKRLEPKEEVSAVAQGDS